MFEPAILPGKRELQYSCDLCGELPISCKRWCCDVCEDFGALDDPYVDPTLAPARPPCAAPTKINAIINAHFEPTDGFTRPTPSPDPDPAPFVPPADICDTCHAMSMQMNERGVSHPGPHSPDHPCTAYKITESAEPVHGGSLKAVMANAIERWFVDTLRNAKNGDANQAALLSEMLSTGYGCTKDAEEAR